MISAGGGAYSVRIAFVFANSRARQTNDNALAECKNGAVIRKFTGYSHIPQ
ncbi:MAG TPA: hypothetical protein VJT81_13610 [Burkholderiales bacterium]|nr:hypothetical protein [Burkholderiales bacterium]